MTPFNGRLFAPARTPLAERRDLDDDAARRAVVALSTRPAADRRRTRAHRLSRSRRRAARRGLRNAARLRAAPSTRRRRVDAARPGSGVRKATGTFYTPQPIADYLVRRTLGAAGARRDARARSCSCGSSIRRWAAARFSSPPAATSPAPTRRRSSDRAAAIASDIGDAERAAIRRTIAERCLYGVDLNPMAVQLARLSLWLATLAADRPLSFLDHRLQVGDSLLGAWLAAAAASAGNRRRRPPASAALPLFDDEAGRRRAARRRCRSASRSRRCRTTRSSRCARRSGRFAALTARDAALSRWKRVADLWCAAWFARPTSAAPPSAFGALSDAILTGRSALPPRPPRRYLEAARCDRRARRLFHWELEFPEVFFDRDGARLPRAGFDAVIGNPPWDMIRADAGAADARAARADRHGAGPALHARRRRLHGAVGRPRQPLSAVRRARDRADAAAAAASAWCCRPASRPITAARRCGGCCFSRCDVDAIVGMDNHRGVFPIHRSVRFLLVTATAGAPTRQIACRLGVDDPAELESIGDEPAGRRRGFRCALSPALLERISGAGPGASRTCAARLDLAIVERAAALFPPLGSASGWRPASAAS